MDFITKLPPSNDPATQKAYDSILIIVNKLTKYTHIVLFKEKYTAAQLVYIIFDRIVRYYKISTSITSDYNKFFIFNYWKILIGFTGIKLRISTAFYPETDE